ncbi:MAG: MATE family efflux transporter [Spirochaetaceae bacterium]
MNKKSRVFKPLILMTVPAIVGMLITFIFQLADTYFIGKLGVDKLAAMSFSYPIYILFIGLFMGMSSGVASTVAKALGEKKILKAKYLTGISVIIFLIIGLVLGIICLYTIDPLFRTLGAKGDTLIYLKEYMGILFPGFFLLVGTLIGNSALMAKGIMIRTTIIMGIGGVINIILDYLLIFGIGDITAMGIKGAAFATVFSWLVTFVLMTILLVREQMISLRVFSSLSRVKSRVIEIFRIGLPAVAAQILNPIAISVLTRVIALSGEGAIASYGIVTKIESLGLTVILALSVILTPFIGRLYGAKENEHIERVIAYSGRISVYWSTLLFITLILWGKNIVSGFTSDVSVIETSRLYFYIIGISLPAFGLTHITTSLFNGVQRPDLSLRLTLVKSLLLTIPLGIAGSFLGVYGVFAGISLGNIIGVLYARKLLTTWYIKNSSNLLNHNPAKDYIEDFRRLFNYIRRK